MIRDGMKLPFDRRAEKQSFTHKGKLEMTIQLLSVAYSVGAVACKFHPKIFFFFFFCRTHSFLQRSDTDKGTSFCLNDGLESRDSLSVTKPLRWAQNKVEKWICIDLF